LVHITRPPHMNLLPSHTQLCITEPILFINFCTVSIFCAKYAIPQATLR